jgi:hypothetical protein
VKGRLGRGLFVRRDCSAHARQLKRRIHETKPPPSNCATQFTEAQTPNVGPNFIDHLSVNPFEIERVHADPIHDSQFA